MSGPLMTIEGQVTGSPETFGVIDPATGEEFARAPECSRAQLDSAIAAAARAGRAWSADEVGRLAGLHAMADAIDKEAEELAGLLTAEQGKPLGAARFEISETTRWLRTAAALDLSPETILDDGSSRAQVHRRPIGVVAAITPWNYPLLLAGWKLGPALRAGNTVVLKPSPYTPLATLRLGEIVNEVLPPGVLSVVSGGDALGAWMTAHPAVGKISFTGSVATGKAVMAAAAPGLKRLTPGTGRQRRGDRPRRRRPRGDRQGPVLGRLHQLRSDLRRHQAGLRARGAARRRRRRPRRARTPRPGRSRNPGRRAPRTIQNRPQFDRVRGLVTEALADGASAAAGGAALEGPGYFFAPTILHRRPRGHAHRRRGAVRPRRPGADLPHGRRGGGAGQRHPVRAVRLGVGDRPGPGDRRRRAARLRHRVRQRPPRARSRAAVRRLQGERPRAWRTGRGASRSSPKLQVVHRPAA
jgi:hypothetical protein